VQASCLQTRSLTKRKAAEALAEGGQSPRFLPS
jgi:hypothetical protein